MASFLRINMEKIMCKGAAMRRGRIGVRKSERSNVKFYLIYRDTLSNTPMDCNDIYIGYSFLRSGVRTICRGVAVGADGG